MPSGSNLSAILVVVLAQAPIAAMAAPDTATPFDGNWTVTLTCPASTDGRALGFSYQFLAQAREGVIEGEHGNQDEPGWLRLSGPIQPDGSAALIAEGMTNLPAYALYSVKRGTHYKHAVTAHFDARHGSGSWITIRTCSFDFARP